MKNTLILSLFFLLVGCSTTTKVSEMGQPPTTLPTEQAGQQPTKKSTVSKQNKDHSPRPSLTQNPLLVLDHKYFVVYYDPSIRLARFVKYTVSASDLRNTHIKRGNKFKTDPLLTQRLTLQSPSRLPAGVTSKEYEHSGYDQGHMAPSGDFAYDQEANNETFVMSNMAPQKPNLNRQAWRLLEDQVRQWACGEEKITVLTGPILSDKPATLASGLPIPEQFFKIVIDETPPRKTIAFIYNQTDKENVIRERIASVDEIESKSHQDFAPELSPEDRAVLRKPSHFSDWKSADCVPKKKKKKAA